MANPLLLFWRRFAGADDDARRPGRARPRASLGSAVETQATIFLVLRRMRAPLIVLILIFAVSVLGLTLIPGQDDTGRPRPTGFFEAFYVMSYTATTIGFGELPYPFTNAQRMWVTLSIYLTVIGWAYAVGSLLALFSDRGFREALALRRFTRRVARLREPFLLIAGYGKSGELLGHAFDALGRRFVVIDTAEDRIATLDLFQYHADVPGLAADAADPGLLGAAGLNHDFCEGVLAMTDDDEVNLAVAMAAALLRPELPVVARTVSPAIAERMHAFGAPIVVNPFDSFGDHLRLALRMPAAYQLLTWLEGGPGADLQPRGNPPTTGLWVVCGYGRFGRELTADLRAEGMTVQIIDPAPPGDCADDGSVVVGDGSDPEVLAASGVGHAVGFVAGTDNDTTNLSLIAAARRLNGDLYVAARQNRPANAPLFRLMKVDSLLVPTETVAHDVYAHLSTPLLRRFLTELPDQGDDWAAALIGRLADRCGTRLDGLWKVRLTTSEVPALGRWLESGEVAIGALLGDPDEREDRLDVVPLLLLRGDDAVLAPADDVVLATGDELLLAGTPEARRELDTTLVVDTVAEYVVTGRQLPAGWLWRRLSPSTSGRRSSRG